MNRDSYVAKGARWTGGVWPEDASNYGRGDRRCRKVNDETHLRLELSILVGGSLSFLVTKDLIHTARVAASDRIVSKERESG